MKKILNFIKDLTALVAWYRRDFEKSKALFIYSDGSKHFINLNGPVMDALSIPAARAGIVSNPDSLPSEMPKLRVFNLTSHELCGAYNFLIYEEVS